ncbi:hypothetical protein NBT05_13055 [Aquimarina sp. ERC-38]|uniref:hypothetical protein n=1 Tax=Aquimarina sp. ERC-38 TaxID=2949996 RepID=UPI0022481ED6|nr:hypothetical protein [Aquimarina sp. ERC-38]UZO79873.1 hypothetical protein NBT05_13055 [Aquimarina sp. ERC-38]
MKTLFTAIAIFTISLQIYAQDVYEDALTAASYAYAHSKKAHGANNVFHTQEYADKAVDSYQKVEDLAANCGCDVANELAYEAKSNMESALRQDTYERSRYYAKQAKEIGSQILEEITNCRANKDNGMLAANELDGNEIAELSEKENELLQRKIQLEAEQAALEAQILEQQKAQAELEAIRVAEFKEQTLVKTKAEQALQKLETALQELSSVLNTEGNFKTEGSFVRNEEDLQNETLDDTKSFYVDRAKELAKSAIQQFAIFEEN